MSTIKKIFIATVLFAFTGTAQAVLIDFKALADGSLGESAWNTLMFKADGTHTTNAGDAFLDITGKNGGAKYAYLDSNNAGLGVCGSLFNSNNANTAFPGSGNNLCDPGSDDNVTYSGGIPESLHFVFDADVVIEKIWLNNNHDGDKSLLNDYVEIGIDGSTNSTLLTNGGANMDSLLNLGINLDAGKSFDVGFEILNNSNVCFDGDYDDCEFYISKIEYTVPEPAIVGLLGLGLVGIGFARRRYIK